MKTISLLFCSLLFVACNQNNADYDVKAKVNGYAITFSGSKNAKFETCGNVKDRMNLQIKSNKTDGWVKENVQAQEYLFYKDGKLNEQTPAADTCGDNPSLAAIAGKSIDIPQTYLQPQGTLPLGKGNYDLLKAKYPNTTYTPESQIPDYVTAQTRFYKIEFNIIKLDGKFAKKFSKEIEVQTSVSPSGTLQTGMQPEVQNNNQTPMAGNQAPIGGSTSSSSSGQ